MDATHRGTDTQGRRPSLHPEAAAPLVAAAVGFPDVTAVHPAVVREEIHAQCPLGRGPSVRAVHDLRIEGAGGPIAVRVYEPDVGSPVDATGLPTIVFAHGGGFVFGGLDTHDEFCRATAQGVRAVVVSVDYRLAPEFPAPAARDDVCAALGWAADHAVRFGGDPGRLVLAGDGAGGALAAAAAIAAHERGGPAVAAQVLLCPMVDDDTDTAVLRWYWDRYAPGDRSDPLLVPARAASFAGLPPAVVVTADVDPARDAGDAYARALAAAGVPVRHRRFGSMFHGFLTVPTPSSAASARDAVWAMTRDLLDHGNVRGATRC